jgi:hypothetical protein
MAEQDDNAGVGVDYKQTLNYSQGVRKRIVEHFVGEGNIPSDPKELNVVLKALGDMDKTTLMDRKNDIDQGAADTSKQVAEAMSEFIQMQKNQNPFQRAQDGTVIEHEPTQETLPPSVDVEKLGDYELVKGEDEVGVITETYSDFMKRMEKEKSENPQSE